MLSLAISSLWIAAVPPPGAAVNIPVGTPLSVAAKSLTQSSGTPTTVAGFAPNSKTAKAIGPAPYWATLGELARQAGGRIEVRAGGGEVVVTPGEPPPSCVAGPFRVAVTAVTCRRDFDSGGATTELRLALNWESRVPVVRLDAAPRITKVSDDLGERTPPAESRARVPAHDCEHLVTVRLRGIPRAASRLTLVEGELGVTAAPGYVTINVPAFGVEVERSGVGVTVSPPTRSGSRVEVVLTLATPPSAVTFESFEAGVRLSRASLRLVSPTGERFAPINFDDEESGDSARITYRFPAALPVGPGWAAVVTTPAPLEEYRVPFTLRDVPLP